MQGIILINKPSGPTSFGAVARVKHLSGEKRIGHTGTLDPMASGVLPMLAGRAAALSDYVMCTDKSYTAVCRLGITTDSYDITGNVLKTAEVNVKIQQLEAVLQSFCGKISQVPPMFSAIKKDGVRLYKLARKGEQVQIDAREVEIKKIELTYFGGNEFEINIDCSKGTYVRSLCYDIGERLGCGATLTKLVRTKTGSFGLDSCVALDDLNEQNIKRYFQNEDLAVSHLPQIFVTNKQAFRFSNGGVLDVQRVNTTAVQDDIVRIKYGTTLVGLGVVVDGQIKAKCVINNIAKEN